MWYWKYTFLKLPCNLMLVMWSKGHWAARIRASHCKSTPGLVWCPWVFCRWIYSEFNLSHYLTWLPHWGAIQIGSFLWYVTTLTSLVTVNIVKMELFLICHITSCEHMFKCIYKFMAGSPSQWVTTYHVWWPLV